MRFKFGIFGMVRVKLDAGPVWKALKRIGRTAIAPLYSSATLAAYEMPVLHIEQRDQLSD